MSGTIHAPPDNPALAGARLTIDLGALADNWQMLSGRAGNAECGAAVKANGYGLGIGPVAGTLWAAGCRTFFVAVPQEGLHLRNILPDAVIYVLNGLFEDAGPELSAANLRPALGSPDEVHDWARLSRDHGRRYPAALHVDTGMTRLGMTLKEADQLTRRPDLLQAFEPTLLMSHLACADDADHPLTARQLAAFQTVRAAYPDLPASLANSAGTLRGADYAFDLVRPGIALYGAEALNGSDNPMKTVVTLESRIIQVRTAPKGAAVGYGATQTLQRDSRLALLSCGYADGYHRAAGAGDAKPGARAHLAGFDLPLVGRVSMDLIAVDVTDVPVDVAHRGAWVELFGENVPVDEVARHASTIGYELLTGLGARLARRYLSSESV